MAMVMMRSWLIYDVYENPHKDRNVRVIVCMCLFGVSTLSVGPKVGYPQLYQL